MLNVLNYLYEAVAKVILVIHAGLSPVFGANSGAAWALSIVLLTVAMRLLLFPLFVKQIRAQRAMQTLQPKVKELQQKHKGDRETLNREMMALYKHNNANPLAGCLPLILQIPVFIALFRVLNYIRPGARPRYGFTAEKVSSAAHAKIFGAPIAAAFNSPHQLLSTLHASAGSVKVLAATLIVAMGLTTFFTQRQMIARTGTPADSTQANTQRILLYVLPFSFAIFGFRFPLGVLLYWLTTNVWSMGQQFFVIRRMPPIVLGAAATGGSTQLGQQRADNGRAASKGDNGRAASTGDRASKADKPSKVTSAKPARQPGPKPSGPAAAAAGASNQSGTPPRPEVAPGQPRANGGRATGSRANASRAKRKGRRGGRR